MNFKKIHQLNSSQKENYYWNLSLVASHIIDLVINVRQRYKKLKITGENIRIVIVNHNSEVSLGFAREKTMCFL